METPWKPLRALREPLRGAPEPLLKELGYGHCGRNTVLPTRQMRQETESECTAYGLKRGGDFHS